MPVQMEVILMKPLKRIFWLLLTCALLLPCFALADFQIPADISAYFSGKSFKGAAISCASDLTGHGKDDCWFVLIRTAKGANVLYHFKEKNGKWTSDFHTSDAVPQTPHNVQMFVSTDAYDWPTDLPFNTPTLTICQLNEEDEYSELTVIYALENGVWNLRRIWSYTDYDSMLVKNGSISYYEGLESTVIEGTVRGVFQRNLRYIRLAAVPKDLKAACAKLTEIPTLPYSDALSAQEIKFTGGKNYAVYTAPGETSLRGANGKAKVSTNGWIQVFGQEDDWLLVQYSIDADHYRFGYISAKALPRNQYADPLCFRRTPAFTTTAVSVTDDPFFSRSVLATLPADASVTYLAAIGNWAYIEVNDGAWYRGFIPLNNLVYEGDANG